MPSAGEFNEIANSIRDLAVSLTVTRPATEALSAGYVTRASEAVSGVQGTMQPQSPKERRYNPEGLQHVETWNVWTLQEIRLGDQITDGASPAVEVKSIEHWQEVPMWKAVGSLVTDDTALPAP